MKTRHLLAALAALLAATAPALASNTGITIQIPAAVTSVAASDVTLLDVAGLYLATDVEAALAEARTMSTSRLLGRTTASTGAVEEITVSSPLTLSGGALGVGTVGVANGGTGVTSLTAYAPVCGGTTTTGAVQSCGTGQNNAGYVWTSNGASALPSWQAASGGGVSDPLTIGTLITTTSLQPRGGGSYPEDQVQIGPGASASATEDNYGSVAIGRNSTAGGNAGAIAIGNGATTTGAEGWGVCIGALASCDGGSSGSVGIGKLATVLYDAVAVGGAATATGNGAVAIGQQVNANFNFSVGIGWNADTTEANQLVIGGPGPINNAYIGKGVTSASPPTNLTMHATDASGSDTAATNYRIAGGAATGNAAGGAIVLLTSDAGASGSTPQTLTEKARIPTDGGVRIADPGTRPACDSTHRGTIWYDAGGAGVADEFTICCKDAANSYAWVYPGSCHA